MERADHLLVPPDADFQRAFFKIGYKLEKETGFFHSKHFFDLRSTEFPFRISLQQQLDLLHTEPFVQLIHAYLLCQGSLFSFMLMIPRLTAIPFSTLNSSLFNFK